jgi:hypothetical protein
MALQDGFRGNLEIAVPSKLWVAGSNPESSRGEPPQTAFAAALEHLVDGKAALDADG